MIKKQFYSMLAKLAVVFIVLTSLPVYAWENPVSADEVPVSENAVPLSADETAEKPEEEQGEGISAEETAGGVAPRLTKLEIYVYADKNDPDNPTNMYLNSYLGDYATTPEEDSTLDQYHKKYIYFQAAPESAPKIRFVATPNRSDVEFEFERLDRNTGQLQFSTGRIAENYYVCEQIGEYRIRVYALDGSGAETIYYTHAVGLDRTEPRISSVAFSYSGQPKRDRNGIQRYGGGKITINGAVDDETGLHEKPYMFDYPNGEWIEENELDARTGNYIVATRDKVGNVRTDLVRCYYIDSDPPMTEFIEDNGVSVNGYKKRVSMRVEVEDVTDVPQDYISLDGQNWIAGDTIDISENGVYEVYTRDVFDHVSENLVEVTNIDKEPPEYSWNIEHVSRGGGFSQKEILHCIALDRKAGIDGDAYSYDGKNTWVGENSLVISENGTYTVCVRDALGNESGITSVDITDIDNTRPDITGVSETRRDTSGIYAGSSAVTVEAADEESGVPDDFVFFDERPGWSRDKVLEVSRNGIYSFRVRDRVGNMTVSSMKIENIDAGAPQCAVRGNPETLTMSKITLQLDVRDEISGIKSVYMADAKAGVKKLLKEYPCDSDGSGMREDSLDVEITANGEYLFYITDMCGNETVRSVPVTKIIKTKKPEKTENPSDGDEDGGSGGSGGGKNPGGGDRSRTGDETVVIGSGNSDKKVKKTGSETGITVRNGSVSEEKVSKTGTAVISDNKYSRYSDGDAGIFEEKDTVSGNALEDMYDSEDFSTDIFESGSEDHFAENSPHELEMIPNPDMIETGESKHSDAGTVVLAVVLMTAVLSALTVFLLVKKGLITLPDVFGNRTGDGTE